MYGWMCTSLLPPEGLDGFYLCLTFKSLSVIDRFMVNVDTNLEIGALLMGSKIEWQFSLNLLKLF
jgi:hypothetical protein